MSFNYNSTTPHPATIPYYLTCTGEQRYEEAARVGVNLRPSSPVHIPPPIFYPRPNINYIPPGTLKDAFRELFFGSHTENTSNTATQSTEEDSFWDSLSEKTSKKVTQSVEKLPSFAKILTRSDPGWQKDNSSNSCSSCNSFFSSKRVTYKKRDLRRHHCRLCGYIFCNKCVAKKKLDGTRVKVCKQCEKTKSPYESVVSPWFPGRICSYQAA